MRISSCHTIVTSVALCVALWQSGCSHQGCVQSEDNHDVIYSLRGFHSFQDDGGRIDVDYYENRDEEPICMVVQHIRLPLTNYSQRMLSHVHVVPDRDLVGVLNSAPAIGPDRPPNSIWIDDRRIDQKDGFTAIYVSNHQRAEILAIPTKKQTAVASDARSMDADLIYSRYIRPYIEDATMP